MKINKNITKQVKEQQKNCRNTIVSAIVQILKDTLKLEEFDDLLLCKPLILAKIKRGTNSIQTELFNTDRVYFFENIKGEMEITASDGDNIVIDKWISIDNLMAVYEAVIETAKKK